MTRCVLSVIVCVLLSSSMARGDDQWPQFRGANSSGIAQSQQIPVEFGPDKNLKWSLDMMPGHSSPCVWDDHLFLTSVDVENSTLETWSINAKDGSVRWRKKIVVDKIEKGHPSFSPASSSPATDGTCVVAYFGSHGLVCYDMDGELLWEIPLQLAQSFAGSASSPAIVDDKVLFGRFTRSDHFLMAVDKKTGKEIWREDLGGTYRPSGSFTATPVVYQNQVILHNVNSIQAYDVDNGELLWRFRCSTTATSTPVIFGDRVLVSTWYHLGDEEHLDAPPTFEKLLADHDQDGNGTIEEAEFPGDLYLFNRPEGKDAEMTGMRLSLDRYDQDKSKSLDEEEWGKYLEQSNRLRENVRKHGLLSIPTDKQGRIRQSAVHILETKAIPEVPSPVTYGNRAFLMKNGGIMTSIDLESGDLVDRKRFGPSGTHYASPIVHNGILIQASGKGRVTMIDVREDKPRKIASNDLGEPIHATPAIANNSLFIRTATKLMAFSEAD